MDDELVGDVSALHSARKKWRARSSPVPSDTEGCTEEVEECLDALDDPDVLFLTGETGTLPSVIDEAWESDDSIGLSELRVCDSPLPPTPEMCPGSSLPAQAYRELAGRITYKHWQDSAFLT